MPRPNARRSSRGARRLESGGLAPSPLTPRGIPSLRTHSFFESKNCMRELLWATWLRKPFVVLVEMDPKYGGLALTESQARLEAAYTQFEKWGLIKELKKERNRQREEPMLQHVPRLEEIQVALFGTRAPTTTAGTSGAPDVGSEVIGPVLTLAYCFSRVLGDAMLHELAELFVAPRSRSVSTPSSRSKSLAISPLARWSNLRASSSPVSRSASTDIKLSEHIPPPADESGASSQPASPSTSTSRKFVTWLPRLSHWSSASTLNEASSLTPRLTYYKSQITHSLHKTPLPAPRFGRKFHVYCSKNNPGARELMQELQGLRHSAALKVTTDESEIEECEQVLVYLRNDTWTSPETSMAFSTELCSVVSSVPLLLAHEDAGLDQEERGGSLFEHIISSTPMGLRFAKIYSDISVPLKGGSQRVFSLAMLRKVIEAVHISPKETLAKSIGGLGSLSSISGLGAAPVPRPNSAPTSLLQRVPSLKLPRRNMSAGAERPLARHPAIWDELGLEPSEATGRALSNRRNSKTEYSYNRRNSKPMGSGL